MREDGASFPINKAESMLEQELGEHHDRRGIGTLPYMESAFVQHVSHRVSHLARGGREVRFSRYRLQLYGCRGGRVLRLAQGLICEVQLSS